MLRIKLLIFFLILGNIAWISGSGCFGTPSGGGGGALSPVSPAQSPDAIEENTSPPGPNTNPPVAETPITTASSTAAQPPAVYSSPGSVVCVEEGPFLGAITGSATLNPSGPINPQFLDIKIWAYDSVGARFLADQIIPSQGFNRPGPILNPELVLSPAVQGSLIANTDSAQASSEREVTRKGRSEPSDRNDNLSSFYLYSFCVPLPARWVEPDPRGLPGGEYHYSLEGIYNSPSVGEFRDRKDGITLIPGPSLSVSLLLSPWESTATIK